MAHDVFISYSTKDKIVADMICARLEKANIRCWIASRDQIAGIDYELQIVQSIEACKTLVLVLSESSNISDHVKNEITVATEKCNLVIPFRIHEIEPSDALKYRIMKIQWLDAVTPPIERHIEKLISTIKGIKQNNTNGPMKINPFSNFIKKYIPIAVAVFFVLFLIFFFVFDTCRISMSVVPEYIFNSDASPIEVEGWPIKLKIEASRLFLFGCSPKNVHFFQKELGGDTYYYQESLIINNSPLLTNLYLGAENSVDKTYQVFAIVNERHNYANRKNKDIYMVKTLPGDPVANLVMIRR
jgi:hypothetical protein